MTIYNRYIIGSILKYFALALLTVIGIFIVIDYLENMDEFVKSGVGMVRALQFVLLKIPFISINLLPVVLLLSILIVFGLMSKFNELTVLNASGISIYAIIKPVLLVSLGVGLLLFTLAEAVVPVTMLKSNQIKYQEIRKKADVTVKKANIWIKGNRHITHINYFNPSQNAIFGFTRFIFDDSFRLIRRIDAHSGAYRNNQWEFKDCMIQTLDADTNAYHVELSTTLKQELRLEPDDFREIVRSTTEMGYQELSQFIDKVRRDGYDAGKYRVVLQAKIAYPFVCVIMGLIGAGLTARKKLSRGIPPAISFGLAIAFLYFVTHNFCLSLGYGEVLPPFAAAWAANVIFLSVGIMLLVNAE